MKCRQQNFKDAQENIIICDICDQALPRKHFDKENVEVWRAGASEPVTCTGCQKNSNKILR